MPPHAASNGRPEIIRAVHGVTPAGDWFLLADVAPARPGSEWLACEDASASGDRWLVVLGRRDRDIITLHGQDA